MQSLLQHQPSSLLHSLPSTSAMVSSPSLRGAFSILLLVFIVFLPIITSASSPVLPSSEISKPLSLNFLCAKFSRCGAGRVCHGRVCYIAPNHPCSSVLKLRCLPGTSCHRGRCRYVSEVGQSCLRSGSRFRLCARGLFCDRHICRINANGVCTKKTNLCRRGTVCVGPSSGKKLCKVPMSAGQRCQVDPYWVCRRPLVCEDKVCRVPVNKSCLIKGKQLPCAKGLSCVGSGTRKLCKALIPAGGRCRNDPFWVCQAGLRCQQGVCRVRINNSCLRKRKVLACVIGSVCVGNSNRKLCKTPMKVGQRCNINPFSVCQSGLRCKNHRCKIPLNGRCRHARNQCVKGTGCVGPSQNMRCKQPRGPGERCDRKGSFQLCRKELKCVNRSCRIPINGPCDQSAAFCIAGAICAGRRGKRRCVRARNVGQSCGKNDYSVCKQDLKCERKVCKIPINGSCLRNAKFCVSGLQCVGTRTSKVCKKPLNVREKCNNKSPFDRCGRNLVCDRGVCRVQNGKNCLGNVAFCKEGTQCVGNRRRKICKKPMGIGQRCQVDPFWVCARSLVCQSHICKLKENGVCTRHQKMCASGLVCIGNQVRKQCRRLLPVGTTCRVGNALDKCMAGAQCNDGRCRLQENKRCDKYENLCSSGLHCVGSDGKKKCKKPMKVGERCNIHPYSVCRSGLVCEGNRCKLAENASCNKNSVCVSGTKCVGKRGKRQCKKPVHVNGVCDQVLNVCRSNLVCDTTGTTRRCKLRPNANCARHSGACVTGTKCFENRCLRPSPAGKRCGKDTGRYCASHLVCLDNVCRIPENGSCTARTEDFCVGSLVCAVAKKSGTKKCQTAGGVFEKCSTDRNLGMKCDEGLECDLAGDKCKIPQGEDCTKNQSACTSGTICVGGPSVKMCVKPMEAGFPCHVDPFWVCEHGLKCEEHTCKVVKGGQCGIPFHKCLSTSTCSNEHVCA